MAIAVKHNGDGCVAGPGCDLLWITSGRNPKRDRGMTKIMNPKRRNSSAEDRWCPEPTAEGGNPNRTAFGRLQNQVVGFLPGEVQCIEDESRNGYGANRRPCLWWSKRQIAIEVDKGFSDSNFLVRTIDAVDS